MMYHDVSWCIMVCLSVYLSIYLSIFLSICMYVYDARMVKDRGAFRYWGYISGIGEHM